MMIEGIHDDSAAIHFRGPVSPERSSVMMSMAPRLAAMAATSSKFGGAGLRDAESMPGHVCAERTGLLPPAHRHGKNFMPSRRNRRSRRALLSIAFAPYTEG
jgi:hypothetical protein